MTGGFKTADWSFLFAGLHLKCAAVSTTHSSTEEVSSEAKGCVQWTKVSPSLESAFLLCTYSRGHITETIYDRLLNISPRILTKPQSYQHYGHHLYLWLINRKCSQWPQFRWDWHLNLYELKLDTKNKTGQTWGDTPGLPGWQDMMHKVTKPEVIHCFSERARTESHVM